jgi:cytoskeletal protein CcmA (bactofilin family)
MIQNQEFTYIGKTSNLTGTFIFSGTTHLQGKLTGNIEIENFAKIILEIGSMTEGNLNCFDVDIYGEFSGEIKSRGLVTIYPTAVINGKIIAKAMEILPGAVVNINGHTDI